MAVPETDNDSVGLARVLAWLAAEPTDECIEDLEALHRHVTALTKPSMPLANVQQCLGALAARLLDIADRFRPRLLNAALPLPRPLHVANKLLIGALLDVADLVTRVGAVAGDAPDGRDDDPALVAAFAMNLVKEAYRLACMGATGAVPGLWPRACRFLLVSCQRDRDMDAPRAGTPAAAVALHFKQMMAVAMLQPEGLTARELAWAFDYLAETAHDGQLCAQPGQPDSASFWIDPEQDRPPAARARHAPPPGTGPLYFRAHALARRLTGKIDWLDKRVAEAEVVGLQKDADLLEPEVSGLPLGLTPAELLSLLRRMRERWTTPPNRALPRRAQLYSVQVCQGLGAIWRIHRGGGAEGIVTEWTVLNESPAGYAITRPTGVDAALTAGMALALRRDPGERWSICIVRWLRSDRAGQAELGLQVISHGCAAISVAFRDGDLHAIAPALELPPLAAVRRNHAILAPAGTYTSRRFVLVRDSERLYVGQGRVLGLEMQTASVELFQYELDPYAV